MSPRSKVFKLQSTHPCQQFHSQSWVAMHLNKDRFNSAKEETNCWNQEVCGGYRLQQLENMSGHMDSKACKQFKNSCISNEYHNCGSNSVIQVCVGEFSFYCIVHNFLFLASN